MECIPWYLVLGNPSSVQSNAYSSCGQDVYKVFFSELFTCHETLTDLISEPKPNQNSKICTCSVLGVVSAYGCFVAFFQDAGR